MNNFDMIQRTYTPFTITLYRCYEMKMKQILDESVVSPKDRLLSIHYIGAVSSIIGRGVHGPGWAKEYPGPARLGP